MKSSLVCLFVLPALVWTIAGCRKPGGSEAEPAENITAEERATAAQLKPTEDPIQAEIYGYRRETRQLYNNRRFDELETSAAELRKAKEVFGNGSWKIVQFYSSFECRDDEGESMWQLHDQIHQDWIKAQPASITARVAYADFLVAYAWRARGSGYADTVKAEGWKLFGERIESARQVLDEARPLPEKDPYWWLVALRVARAQGWKKAEYDALTTEATTFEPQFWGFDAERSFSLLPRWYGQPGDWEAYAEQAAAREGGLGAEAYARIVIYLRGFHENIFRDTKASWPLTRQGLEQMRKKYPDSLEILSQTAMLAVYGEDRELAKAAFAQLGQTYLPGVWRKPERFAHFRTWAETGQW